MRREGGAVLPVAPGGGGEHPEDDELDWLRELGGRQPAPAPRDEAQRQEGVEEEGGGGLGQGLPLLPGGRGGAPRLLLLEALLAAGYQEGEEDEGGGGQHYSDLGNNRSVTFSTQPQSSCLDLPVRMEQKHKCQQNQGDGEGRECEVNNPLLYFHHCNKEAQSSRNYFTILNTFLFRFSCRGGDFMGYLDPITKIIL